MFERSIPSEAKPAFSLHPPGSTAKAWCMFKGDASWGTPARTKRSLLIGYDLMPLNGLAKCERLLAKNGIHARRCEITTCDCSTLLGVTHHSNLKVDSCCWSTFCDYENRLRQIAGASFDSACGWVGDEIEKTHLNDARTLVAWFMTLTDYKVDRWTVRDKRRATTTRKLIADCAKVFQRHDYRIVPVRVLAAAKAAEEVLSDETI